MSKELDKFGKFIMKHLRDEDIDKFDILSKGLYKADALAKIQSDLVKFNPEQLDIVRRSVVESIDTAIHSFLSNIQENIDFDNDVQILVDGKNIAELSDGLHGEAFLDDGW